MQTQTPPDMGAYTATELLVNGIVVVDLFDACELQRMNASFQAYLLDIPEYSKKFCELRDGMADPKDRRVNAGGFAALNCASSFHTPFVRATNDKMYGRARPILHAVARLAPGLSSETPNTMLECIPDRTLFRTRGDKPSGESVHRDLSTGLLPTDHCFGSMVNLNLHEDQGFSVELGTHLLSSGTTTGFTRIEQQAEVASFKANRTLVRVPPGHMAIFYENIKHEVLATRYKHDIYRKFLGFRLTTSTGMLYPGNADRFARQAPLIHKGGDVSPMYPKLYLVNHRQLLARFAALRFDNPLMYTGVHTELASRKRACNGCAEASCTLFWHRCVLPLGRLRKECPSLRELGCMYTPYTDEELAKFHPQPLSSG